MRRIALAIVGAAVLLGCSPASSSTGSRPTRPGATTAPSVAPPASLTPSIPGLFRTGTNFCGDPYALTATTVRGTIPLLDCPGLAGLDPTPSVSVRVGDEILISGLPHTATLSRQPVGLTTARGSTFVAVTAGSTVLVIHNFPCLPAGSGAQPRSCPLLAIVTR